MHHAGRRLRFATTRLASGPQVHYAEQGDPDGETILLLPAYADSWFSYSRVLPLLPTRDHAYALDQRGHGDDPQAPSPRLEARPGRPLVAFDDAAELGRITASTLLIWGDQDAVVSREEQQRLKDAIPEARLQVYPDSGHSPHWEHPEAVAADLASFPRP